MELSDDTAAIFDKGLSVGLPGQPSFYSKKLFEVGRHVVMLSREKKNFLQRASISEQLLNRFHDPLLSVK